jgi:hypothetical protein
VTDRHQPADEASYRQGSHDAYLVADRPDLADKVRAKARASGDAWATGPWQPIEEVADLIDITPMGMQGPEFLRGRRDAAVPRYVDLDARRFPPGEVRRVKITHEGGRVEIFEAMGEDIGDGLTRYRLHDGPTEA